jgi:hypothetical protein
MYFQHCVVAGVGCVSYHVLYVDILPFIKIMYVLCVDVHFGV